jgi:hypothetical protein
MFRPESVSAQAFPINQRCSEQIRALGLTHAHRSLLNILAGPQKHQSDDNGRIRRDPGNLGCRTVAHDASLRNNATRARYCLRGNRNATDARLQGAPAGELNFGGASPTGAA